MRKYTDRLNADDIQRMSDADVMQAVFDICNAGISATVASRIRTFRMSEEDMNDCVTAVYIQLFDQGCRRVRKFRGECSFKTFICTVSDRILLDHIGKEIKVRDRTSGIDLLDSACAIHEDRTYIPDRQFFDEERRKEIEFCESLLSRAMNELPPEEYSALMFRFYQKKEYHEINDLMGIHNAAYLIKKALSRTRYLLGKEGENIHRFIAEECL